MWEPIHFEMEGKRQEKERTLIISDFDGTLSQQDIGHQVLKYFAGEDWHDIEQAYRSGRIGSKEAYTQVSKLLNTTREQMVRFMLHFSAIDQSFKGFYRFCKNNGYAFKIVSDGLDFYIYEILKKSGYDTIEYFSNVVFFRDDQTLIIKFPRYNSLCGKCGTCKTAILKRYRLLYKNIVYIGDGFSDICASKEADIVFAKNILYEKCLEAGKECILYNNFKEIKEILKKLNI